MWVRAIQPGLQLGGDRECHAKTPGTSAHTPPLSTLDTLWVSPGTLNRVSSTSRMTTRSSIGMAFPRKDMRLSWDACVLVSRPSSRTPLPPSPTRLCTAKSTRRCVLTPFWQLTLARTSRPRQTRLRTSSRAYGRSVPTPTRWS